MALPRARPARLGSSRCGARGGRLSRPRSIVVVIGVDRNRRRARRRSSPTWRWSPCPPLAALALGWLIRGSRPAWALAAIPLFALAWAAKGALAGEAAAAALSGLACVTLGWLLVSGVPAAGCAGGSTRWRRSTRSSSRADLLQGPNAVLIAAAPGRRAAAPAGDPLRLRRDGLRRRLRRRDHGLPARRSTAAAS